MAIQFAFAVLSSLVGIACFIPYLWDIFKHKTQPHSYSWLIWTILQITTVVAMLKGGAGIGIASLAIGAPLCGFIFFLSFHYGTHNIKVFDTICLIGALIAICVYLFLHDPLLTVIIITITDFIGFLPTLRKAYEEPNTETLSNYVLSSFSSLLAIGALQRVNVTTSLYLISLVITNGICAMIIIRGNRLRKI
jgi:hypothetical protein